MTLAIPRGLNTAAIWADGRKHGGNAVRQLLVPAGPIEVTEPASGVLVAAGPGGSWPAAWATSGSHPDRLHLRVPFAKPAGGRLLASHWGGSHAPIGPTEVRNSHRAALRLIAEDEAAGTPGLRRPQLGAVHSVLGYWTTGRLDPATVVMPTGTGKTETMVALYISPTVGKLLIIVPTDALRFQTARKFETFGVLLELGVLDRGAIRPSVGRLEQGLRDVDVARAFAEACDVVVATPAALSACAEDARIVLLDACTHLFVDEAHHVAAASWSATRDRFQNRPVVQFTATPFREDGRHLGGHMVYSFPLREAQRDGYFAPIRYVSVIDFDNADQRVAARAVQVLRDDLAAGREHVLMARVRSVTRVKEVLPLYQELAPDLAPVAVWSNQPLRTKAAGLKAIREGTSRIVVCVNMLGEGFDLPSLKVAAVHDAQKSLGVTLQFIGRFARTKAGDSLGAATLIVARPDLRFDSKLRSLYSEDADWNLVLEELSETAVASKRQASEFEEAFGSLPSEVSMRSLLPKMSTVVYRVKCSEWAPEAAVDLFGPENMLTSTIGVNQRDRVAWFVVERRQSVRWGDIQTVEEVAYELYVIYWDEIRKLLYINSSDNQGFHQDLADAVAGPEAQRVIGTDVYRVMAQVKRLVPTNVGVLDTRNRSRRFSFHVGADVTEGFPTAEAQTKTQTNIFAYGYDDGHRSSIGASLKGRIWSHRVAASLKDWRDWCDEVGGKVTDPTINVDKVIASFIRPRNIDVRPDLVLLAAEWPWQLHLGGTDSYKFEYDGKPYAFMDTEWEVVEFSATGPLRLALRTAGWSVAYDAVILDGAISYVAVADEVQLLQRRGARPLSEMLNTAGLLLLFEGDLVVEPSGFALQVDRDLPPFDVAQLEPIDWSDVDLKVESQGATRNPASIQARAIVYVRDQASWDVVVDDDGSGEIADVVCLRIEDNRLVVQLVHCKYSAEKTPGARVEDVYEVCGQAMKSGQWRRDVARTMLDRLIERVRRRQERTGTSSFEVGDPEALYRLQERAAYLAADFHMLVVQPGISKSRVSRSQLEVLAGAEVYVSETARATLRVLCSD